MFLHQIKKLSDKWAGTCHTAMRVRSVMEITMGAISLLIQIEQLKTENERLKNRKVDCSKCLNKGVTNGFSQESFCEGCLWQGNTWKSDNYKL